VDSLRVAQDLTRYSAVWNVAVFAQDVDRARELALALQEPSRSAEVRATGHLADAILGLARGRPSEADAALARVAQLDASLALTHGAALALLPFAQPALRDLARFAAALDEWDAQPGCTSDHPVRFFEPGTCIRPLVRAWLSGMLDARLGRPDRARARVAELEAWAERGEDEGHGAEFAAEVRAELALQQGDSLAALEALEAAPGHVFYVQALQSLLYSHGRSRFRRAQLLVAAGRLEEAIRWYESFDEMDVWNLVFQGPAQLHAGAILESLGRVQEASAHYRKALDVLEGGEGPWDAMARLALAGIARTGG
jgi:tetratricopeptide (TPR) repeat protein